MGQHDDSQDVQNRFTAYLLVALTRKKCNYQREQVRLKGRECSTDFQDAEYPDCRAYGVPDWPRYTHSALMEALSRLTERERYIIFERVLNGREYNKLADGMNLRYNSTASIYRRAIQKLKRALKEGQE